MKINVNPRDFNTNHSFSNDEAPSFSARVLAMVRKVPGSNSAQSQKYHASRVLYRGCVLGQGTTFSIASLTCAYQGGIYCGKCYNLGANRTLQ